MPVGGISSAGGVRLFIGDAVIITPEDSPDLADYEAMSWLEVGEVEDMGQYGDESATIEFTALKDARKQKLTGPRDAGTAAVVVGAVPGDPGQIAMNAAEGTPDNYGFKVIRNDAVTPLSGTPTIDYFSARVMSQRLNVGNVMNVLKVTFNLGINTAITSVEAT